MDLLIVLKFSALPVRDRVAQFLEHCAAYPTDIFPLTEEELSVRLRENDPFWTQAIREGIEVYPD